jgi:hypothetical protein
MELTGCEGIGRRGKALKRKQGIGFDLKGRNGIVRKRSARTGPELTGKAVGARIGFVWS